MQTPPTCKKQTLPSTTGKLVNTGKLINRVKCKSQAQLTHAPTFTTRKLSYRKDDRAKRHI